jgi:hypothetical protein
MKHLSIGRRQRTGAPWIVACALRLALGWMLGRTVLFTILVPNSALALSGSFKLSSGATYTRSLKVTGDSRVSGASKMSFAWDQLGRRGGPIGAPQRSI